MNEPASSPGLETAIEAAADCVRLYRAALDVIGDDHHHWRDFIAQMVLRRETLLHRLRYVGKEKIEPREINDLAGWRSWLGEIGLSLKGLVSDPVRSALAALEPAETRLVEALGAIGVITADPEEIIEIVEAVTAERDILCNLLSDLSESRIDGPDLAAGSKVLE